MLKASEDHLCAMGPVPTLVKILNWGGGTSDAYEWADTETYDLNSLRKSSSYLFYGFRNKLGVHSLVLLAIHCISSGVRLALPGLLLHSSV